MKKILLFGAGKSATSLIEYLLRQCALYDWKLIVADGNLEIAKSKIGEATSALAVKADVLDTVVRTNLINQSDIVISMLPATLHFLVAQTCIEAEKHLLTASYIDGHIREMEPLISAKKLLFLCEMGLDPGIDHMSALRIIHEIQKKGGEIHSFYSHCGGLVAPESDNNPWHYKISWNPRNIVLAGKAGAIYKLNGQIEQLAYQELFDPNRTVEIPGQGYYAWYPNRDSLSYIGVYGLEKAATYIRTTLRHPDFCKGWKTIVTLGLTNEETLIDSNRVSYFDFLQDRLPPGAAIDEDTAALLAYLGLYTREFIGRGNKTAADIMQFLLEEKLMLQPSDKDMIVMLHELEYTLHNKSQKTTSCLVVKGENNLHTAMAKTVGLPLGITASLLLRDKISLRGLHIPVLPEIYDPVLAELEKEGIVFEETSFAID